MAETLNLRGTLKGCVSRPPRVVAPPARPEPAAFFSFRGPRKNRSPRVGNGAARPTRRLPWRGTRARAFVWLAECLCAPPPPGGPRDHTERHHSLTVFSSSSHRRHEGWVTSIATPIDNSDILLSSSRDKTVILWNLTREEGSYGFPQRSLRGHSHFVQDVVISSDGQFALSGSWDGTLRLWDLNSGSTTRRFVGHSKDVLSVAFSVDNRQIVSGSRDKTIKLWNTLGECKYTTADNERIASPAAA